MELTSKQKRHLRSLAHHRPVVVTVGQHGLTDAVLREIDRALSAHELIKVRFPGTDRAQRRLWVDEVCRRSSAVTVQAVGRVESLYRPAPQPQIVLP